MFRKLEGQILELRTLHHDMHHKRVMPKKGQTKYNSIKKKLLDKLPDLVAKLNMLIGGHRDAAVPGGTPTYQDVELADLKALCNARADGASPLTFPWEDVRLKRMASTPGGAWPRSPRRRLRVRPFTLCYPHTPLVLTHSPRQMGRCAAWSLWAWR